MTDNEQKLLKIVEQQGQTIREHEKAIEQLKDLTSKLIRTQKQMERQIIGLKSNQQQADYDLKSLGNKVKKMN